MIFDDFGHDKIKTPWSDIPMFTAIENLEERENILEQGYCEMIFDHKIVHESWKEIFNG